MSERPPQGGSPEGSTDSSAFAARSDASFFAAYPSRDHRVRPYIPREFGNLDPHVDRALVDSVERTNQAPLLVVVWLIGPGLRAREPLFNLLALDALGVTRN